MFFGVGDGPPRHARQMLYNRTLLQVQRFLFGAIADVETQIKTVAQISLIGFYSVPLRVPVWFDHCRFHVLSLEACPTVGQYSA